MEILLDGNKVLDKEILFETLKEQLNSEEFYGSNLDSLWDVLSNHIDNLVIIIVNIEKLESNLGGYSSGLLDLFKELNIHNIGVTLNIES